MSNRRQPLRCEILRHRPDFERLHDHGKALRAPEVVVVYLRGTKPHCRYAVIAGRKVGNAVRRNRAKRHLREAHRSLHRQVDLTGLELLLIARASAADSGTPVVTERIRSLFKKEGLLLHGADIPDTDGSVTN